MFWEYGIVASTLDQIFEKDEPPTLEDVLNEDDLLQELKVQNEKLIKFLSTSECMENLVKYLTTDTSDDCDPKTRFNYSNLASEVLTAGFTISNLFTESFKYIKDIWAYLCDRKPKNILMICFITKVLGYYSCSYPEFMYCFLTEHTTDCVDELLYLSDCPSVCEFIVRLQTRDTHPFYPKFVEFLLESNLIKKIISFVIPNESRNKKLGLSLLCVDIVRTVRSSFEHDSSLDIDDRLLVELLSDENLSLLITNITKIPYDKDTLVAGLTILTSLFNYERVGHINGDPFMIPNSLDSQSMRVAKTNFSSLVKHIEAIQGVLINFKNETRKTPSDEQLASLGLVKMLIVELFVSLMLHSNEDLDSEFKRLRTLSVIWDLMEEYQENNFLHSCVQILTECIFQGVRWRCLHDPINDISDNLLKSLFDDVKIVERVIKLFNGPSLNLSGHITEILRVILSCSSSPDFQEIKLAIEKLPESLKTDYENAVEKLKKIDELEAVDRKFTKGIFINYEENNEEFGAFSSPQFLLSFDKGINLMKTAKESCRYDENIDKVETEMNININTSYIFEGDNLADLSSDYSMAPMNYQFLSNISPVLNAEIDTIGDLGECDVDSEVDRNQTVQSVNSDSHDNVDLEADLDFQKTKWFNRVSTLDGWEEKRKLSSKMINSLQVEDVCRGGTSSPLPMEISNTDDFEAFSADECKDDPIE